MNDMMCPKRGVVINLKIGRLMSFVSVFLVLMFLVSSFVLVADKKAFAATTPVTWNPNDKGSGVVLSNGNLTAVGGGNGAWQSLRATGGMISGKTYWEVTINSAYYSCDQASVGFGNDSATLNNYMGADGNACGYGSHTTLGASIACGGITLKSSLPMFSAGDTIGIALDVDNKTASFYRNNSLLASINYNISGAIYPMVSGVSDGSYTPTSYTANFGATAFAYPIPTGYSGFDGQSANSTNSPTNLLATAGSGQASLTWTTVTSASCYNVKRSTTLGGPYTTISTSLTSPNYTDTSVTNGTTYYYVVTAVSANGESGNSNEVTATPTGAVTPPVTTGNKAILEMITGTIKEFDLTATELQEFITWYDGRSNGAAKAYYIFTKKSNIKPFLDRKEYIAFDKISSFEVKAYSE